MFTNVKCFVVLVINLIIVGQTQPKPQFWDVRDMYIWFEKDKTLCYKQEQIKGTEPELRIRSVSFCCPGYRRNPLVLHSLECDPICTEDCRNGFCSAPDICICYPGFQRKGGRCERIY